MTYIGCSDCDNDEGLGIAIPTVGSAISIVGGLFGTRTTGATVYREDGARWSAAKQYWEDPPGTKAPIQSPKPSGPPDICTGAFACLQSMSGGPVAAPSGAPVQLPKGAPKPVSGVSSVSGVSQAYPPMTTAGIAGIPTPLLLGGAALALYAFTRKR
jgi:hypothetical protein